MSLNAMSSPLSVSVCTIVTFFDDNLAVIDLSEKAWSSTGALFAGVCKRLVLNYINAKFLN